jgi:hypothetical protein
MEDDLKRFLEEKTLSFLSKEVILPVLNSYIDGYDERCYSTFTKELADIFEETLPDYFDTDYSRKVGQYFFCSIYGEYIPTSMLIEVILEEVNFVYVDTEEDRIPRRFSGLEVYFSDHIDTIKYVAEEAVSNASLNLGIIKELVIAQTLIKLNNEY